MFAKFDVKRTTTSFKNMQLNFILRVHMSKKILGKLLRCSRQFA